MAWETRYSGVCADCGSHFPEGALIKSRPGLLTGYVHDVCPDPLAVERPPCPVCFLVHPDGACDR
jgi:hypothetical protein